MTATSVTGTGYGSAEGNDMGRKEYTISGDRIIGPRVVAAGRVTLTDAATYVTLPRFPLNSEDYMVVCTDETAVNVVAAGLTFADNYSIIGIAGTIGDVIQWAIFRLGIMP